MCVGIEGAGARLRIREHLVVCVSNMSFDLRLSRSGVGLFRLSGSAAGCCFSLYTFQLECFQGDCIFCHQAVMR